ncbi:MAG: hypothetical protein KY461_13585 [Actinobacteria bacterium]|nr:hypothetical protein [Actinomycetota bacterium]
MRRAWSVTAAALAAVAAAAVPAASSSGPPQGGASGCDPDGVHATYVLDGHDAGTVAAVVVRGIDPACDGQTLDVVLEGRAGSALVESPVTTVPIRGGVDAATVTQVVVQITPRR